MASSNQGQQASAQPGTRADAQGARGKWSILGVVCLGAFMTTLDGSIVNIALPSVANAFGVSLGGPMQWVLIAYLVVIASTLLAFGRLSDAVGARRVWTLGIVLFTVSSVACGLAPELAWLVGFRAVQGLGAAMMLAPSIALITTTFPVSQRGRALGINAVVVSLGVSIGPVLGGLMTEFGNWRWIFFVNAPVGVINFFWTLRTLPRDAKGEPSGFDVLGALLFALGLAGLMVGLSFGRDWGWGSPAVLSALAVGVAGIAAALFSETRVKRPLVDLKMFENRVFTSAFFGLVLGITAFFSVGFLMPFYFEQLRGFSTARAGLLLTPMSIAVGLMGPVAGSLADRIGSRLLSPLGLAVAAVGLFMLSRLDASSAVWFIVTSLTLSGVGLGIFASPNTYSLMGATPSDERGMASGLLSTGRTVAQALSVAIAGALFAGLGGAAAGDQLERGAASGDLQRTFVTAFGTALLVASGIAVLAFAVSLIRGKPPRDAPDVGAGRAPSK